MDDFISINQHRRFFPALNYNNDLYITSEEDIWRTERPYTKHHRELSRCLRPYEEVAVLPTMGTFVIKLWDNMAIKKVRRF